MANSNGTYQTTPNGKGFRPRTAIEWITLFTLFAGIVASIYSSVLKPYHHIIECRELLVKNKESIIRLEQGLDKLEDNMWQLINKRRN